MDTIIARLAYFADSQPDHPAFVAPARALTYGELWQRVTTTAAWLHQHGVRAGDTVAVSLDVSGDLSVAALQSIYALAYLGAVCLPLYPGVPLANAVALTERFGARHWLVGGGPRPATSASVLDLKECLGAESALQNGLPPRGDKAERPFIYHFTSGTTGPAKPVLFAARQFSGWLRSMSSPYGATARDRQVGSQFWPSKNGIRDLFRIHDVGGTYVNVRTPETRLELASLIRDFAVTWLVVSPWQMRRLLTSPEIPDLRLPALRILSVGGALIFPEEIRAGRALLTPNVYVTYGTNEIGGLATLHPDEPAGVSGRVGKSNAQVEAQAVDEADQPLPAGSVGKLRFRTPWMSQRYVDNEEATARSFRDGWFYPNDLGLLDADGSIVVRGRSDDVINFGGVKIVPGDVERILMEHPNVVDAAVVGVPNLMVGEVAAAFLVARGAVSVPELQKFCAARMNTLELPALWVTVPEIPRNPAGKILRAELRATHFPQGTRSRGTASLSAIISRFSR